MAVTIEKILEQFPGSDLTLIAGKEGLERQVKWVHVSETPEMAGYLTGGELVLMTGVGLDQKDDHSLLAMIRALKEKNAAGVILNMGRYIFQVPQEVKKYCDEERLPLFTMPWHTAMEKLIQPVSQFIMQDNDRQSTISAAFRNAVFFPEKPELYRVPLMQYGFEPEWRYSVTIFRNETSSGNQGEETEQDRRIAKKLAASLSAHMEHVYEHIAVFPSGREVMMISACQTREELRKVVDRAKIHVRKEVSETAEFLSGTGKLTQSIRCLYKSYRQAQAILKLVEKHAVSEDACFYDDMGMYRLLMGIEDMDIARDYCRQIMGPLLTYDREKGSDLAKVLRCYLKHNGSVQDTAADLFIHKNTVTYKIKRCAEILHMDLSSLEARLEVMLCFLLEDMM